MTLIPTQAFSEDKGEVIIYSDSQISDKVTGIHSANGNVIIDYPSKALKSKSFQAQFFSGKRVLVLSGNVKLWNNNYGLIEADRVVYKLLEEKFIADSKINNRVSSKILINNTSFPKVLFR